MIFQEGSFKQALILQYGMKESATDQEVGEEFLRRKNEYVRNVKDWKRAQTQSMNWKKYRAIYQIGINQFHRNGKNSLVPDLVDKVKKEIGLKENQFLPGLLEILSTVEREVIRQMQIITFEEQYVENTLFLEKALATLCEIKISLLSGIPLTEEHWEILQVLDPQTTL